MVGKLFIEISDSAKKTKYYLETCLKNYGDYDYLLEITIPSTVKVDIMKLKVGVNKFIKRKLTSKQYAYDFPEDLKLISEAVSKDIDLFDACEVVVISDKHQHVIDSFEEMPDYKNKKIYISDRTFDVTRECLEELKKQYRTSANLYLKVDGNNDYVSFTDYEKTVEIISSVVEKIKSYNMSPLENIMYAFDYARDRLYVKEAPEEKITKSRDLTAVLLGDKIVCAGYAEIFDKILKGLGNTSSVYIIDFGDVKHAIVVAYIKDEKYDIEGIYYFDPTANRKKDSSDEHFNNYSCFARTRQNFESRFNYSDKRFGDFWISDYYDALNDYENIEKEKNREIRIALMNINNFFKGIPLKQRYGSIDGDTLSKQELTDALDKYNQLYYQPIDLEKMFKALLQVRKVEYYENPEKYELSFDRLLEIVQTSMWGTDNAFYYFKEAYDNFCTKVFSDLETYGREIEQVKLTKVLSNIKK